MKSEAAIASLREKFIAENGPWTAHNIQLSESVFTRSASDPAGCPWLLPVLQDFVRKPFHELRIVDLACLEGLYGIEFARLGAEVVGIEGRESNLAKARFVKEVLNLDRLTLLLDDVRNLSVERHDSFDIVFCSGILYHLDVPDVFDFVRRMADVCSGFLFLNTHISPAELGDNAAQLGPLETFPFEGYEYTGRRYPEHDPSSSADHRVAQLWASLDNPSSVWFSIGSLRELLVRSGFQRVYHCLTYWNTADRITLIATKRSAP
jgi:2-polyprenyl-3-methyl-5-hydroxy-6-metoxy-1,4-benzoquinol methylase